VLLNGLTSGATMTPYLHRTTLFAAGRFRAFEMGDADVPALQAFFEGNPEYYLIVGDQPPKSDEAHEEVHGPLPEGWSYTKKWIIGFADDAGALAGMANVVSDLLAPRVWHIGFFIVATTLQGSGAAQELYEALERWMRDQGATWLRLGVVDGNTRAERFWKAQGYVEVRKRTGIEMGARVNTVSVMVKSLADGTLGDYLAVVGRDKPD
jgi:ribosomal protein S18 acetylase RimI-like enzyme